MKLSIDEIRNGFKAFPFDLRGEIILNRLMPAYNGESSVFLQPYGLSKRKLRRDLSTVEFTEQGDLMMMLSRESIYDALPEGLFHQTRKTSSFKTADEMIADVHHNNKIELEARKLFLPFDDALGWLRVYIETKENICIALEGSFIDLEDFCSFWNIPSDIDKELVSRLLWIYPVIPYFAGKKEKIEELLQIILQVDLEIEMVQRKYFIESPVTLNGNNYLGHTFCIGNTFTDDVLNWVVRLKVRTYEEYLQFLPSGRFYSAINLCDALLFPADITPEYKIDLLTRQEMVLGGEGNAMLGICSLS